MQRRNLLLNVFEGAFYVTGSSLVSSQTVLPALVTRLGGGNMAIGALGVISWMGIMLPQVFASWHGQTLQWKKPWIIRYGAMQRFLILLIAVVLLATGRSFMSLTLVIFLVLYGLNQLILGATSPVWFDFYAKLVSHKLRGRSFGLRNSLAGIMSLGGSFLLAVLLKGFEFPLSFSLVFVLAFVLEMCSLVMQASLVEEQPSRTVSRQLLADYLRKLRDVLKENMGFRRLLLASSFLILSTMPLGFFTVYALNHFRLDDSMVGLFTLVMVGGQVVGALMIGYLADRHGNKVALLTTSVSMLAAILVALVAPSSFWYTIVFVFLGVNLGSELMIRYNFAIEYCSVEHRSTYVGLMNTVLSPCYLTGLAGGWVITAFGYEALFIVGGACSLAGILFLMIAVREPLGTSHPEPSFARPEETVLPEPEV